MTGAVPTPGRYGYTADHLNPAHSAPYGQQPSYGPSPLGNQVPGPATAGYQGQPQVSLTSYQTPGHQTALHYPNHQNYNNSNPATSQPYHPQGHHHTQQQYQSNYTAHLAPQQMQYSSQQPPNQPQQYQYNQPPGSNNRYAQVVPPHASTNEVTSSTYASEIRLMDMGFAREPVRVALAAAKGNVEEALNLLLQQSS
eukprot:gene58-58_t